MSEQEIIIHMIEKADIENVQCWFDVVLSNIRNQYAKGYLTAKAEQLLRSFSEDEEEFREELIRISSYDSIWDK